MILKEFQELLSELDAEELEELYEAFKKVLNSDLYFEYENFEIHHDYTYFNGRREYTYGLFLEIDRVRKNLLLKEDINNLVKVRGIVSNVKFYANTALFCLSPCIIDGEDIGHTWVRYSPEFKKIKYNSTVSFYTQIKRYGNGKSGVDWQEVSRVEVVGGDNSPLYNIPLQNSEMRLDMPDSLVYVPRDRSSFSFGYLKFDNEFVYKIRSEELLFDDKVVCLGPETKNKINELLLFEWLCKLEDWEFWGFANRQKKEG